MRPETRDKRERESKSKEGIAPPLESPTISTQALPIVTRRFPCSHPSGDLAFLLETLVAYYFLWAVPFQISFDHETNFDAFYAVDYGLDLIMVTRRGALLFFALRQGGGFYRGHHASSRSGGASDRIGDPSAVRRQRVESAAGLWERSANALFKFLIVFPYDAFLWATSARAWVPWLRLTRLVFAPIQVDTVLDSLERSQMLPFSFSRSLRVLNIFFLACHWLSCAFYYFAATAVGAEHYASAPWLTENATNANALPHYLRSNYWSMMTLTTTGHVDIINDDRTNEGTDWEVCMAVLVVLFATFVYIYVNANFTSMMLRFNTRLEDYRKKLQGLDLYLERNKVSRDLQRIVRRYCRKKFSEDGSSIKDEDILEQMPRSLRREVLLDIYMRTLRRTPTFLGCDHSLMIQFCSVIKRATYQQHEVLGEQGDVMTEIFFLESGRLKQTTFVEEDNELEDEDDSEDGALDEGDEGGEHQRLERPMRESTAAAAALRVSSREPLIKTIQVPGTPVCEAAFLFSLRQDAFVEALTASTCLVMAKNDFSVIMKEHPDVLDRLQRNAMGRLRQLDDPLVAKIESIQATQTQRQVALAADLFFAAADGELAIVREALEEGGVDINVADYEGRTALHIAASAGQLAVVQFLLERKAAHSVTDAFGKTALDNALLKRHALIVKTLRDAGAQRFANESETAASLCEKARGGLLSPLKLLLSCGVNVNAADYDQRTCLHLAASEGNLRIVELLLENKADANATDRWGGTPLRDALRSGHFEVAIALRAHGAKLKLDEKATAAELCELVQSGKLELLREMLANGANADATAHDDRTCLHVAAAHGNTAIVRALLEEGAQVNRTDRWGRTPLREAVHEGHRDVAALLRANGGDLGMSTTELSIVLCTLAQEGKVETLETFLNAGADANSADYDGRTPLHVAAAQGSRSVIETLLKHRARADLKDRWGQTPQDHARREVGTTGERLAELLDPNQPLPLLEPESALGGESGQSKKGAKRDAKRSSKRGAFLTSTSMSR